MNLDEDLAERLEQTLLRYRRKRLTEKLLEIEQQLREYDYVERYLEKMTLQLEDCIRTIKTMETTTKSNGMKFWIQKFKKEHMIAN
jgi:hypothetical protein